MWLEEYVEARRKQRLLRGAASRLARPALAACVAVWRAQWMETERARAAKRERVAQREKERDAADHEGRRSELEHELAKVKLDAREEQASFAKSLAARAEAERERRTEHVQEMAVRRLGKRELGRGWQAWLDEYMERRRKQRLLAAAAGRLARPAQSAALTHWRKEWQAEQTRMLEEGQAQLRHGQEALIKAHEREIAALRASMEAALESKDEEMRSLAERLGGEVLTKEQEHQLMLAQQAEELKEKRVEHTMQMAARRLGKQQLSKGWQTWLDLYLEQQRHKRMLAAAAGRLMRPALSAALVHWRADWQEELRAALEEGQRILRAEQARRDAAHADELEALKEEMAARQAKLDDERRWQQEQRLAVTADAKEKEAAAKVAAADVETEYQRRMAEQAEAEKDARVAHLQQMAIRRFGKAEILRGWQAWYDLWAQESRQRRILAAAAGRLSRPALAASLTHWREDWEAMRIQAALNDVRAGLEAKAQRAAEAADEALEAERRQQQSDARALAEAAEEARERRIEHTMQMAARRLGKQQLTKGWQTWLDLYLEQQRHKRMLAAASGRLARPALASALAHWRADWQEELRATLEEGHQLLLRDQASGLYQLEKEIERLKEEHAQELASLEQRLSGEVLTKEQEHAKELAAQAEAAHEKRMAHLQQMAAKRMMQAGLTKGWQSWLDLYLEHQRQKRMLAAAAGRLARPALAAALTAWREDWASEQRRALEEGQALLRAEHEGHTYKQQARSLP